MFCWALHLSGAGPKLGRYAFVAVEHEAFYFGFDYDDDDYDDDDTTPIHVHVFNTVSLRWRTLRGENHPEVPSGCRGCTAVLIEDTVYIWGGQPRCNGLHAFDVDAHRWSKPRVSGTEPPEGRHNHRACVLGKFMYVLGGWTWTESVYNDDLYRLDSSTRCWSLINTRGPPPTSLGFSVTVIGTKLFVFGGYWGQWDWFYNDLRVFDTETDCWLKPPSGQLLPEERCDHSAFAYNGELYIYGGSNEEDDSLNDLWKLNPETFSWKRKVGPQGKGPRSRSSGMDCCMLGDRVILFGAPAAPNDLHVLDLSPSLKTLCKLAVLQYGVEQSGLPHDVSWELRAMTTNSRAGVSGRP